jgi:putative transcriptional regulator
MAQLNINNLLKQYNLTQKDLSDCTDINKNTISKYCNNTFENINKTHIDLMCKFFKCTPNDLFEIDNTVEVKDYSSKLSSGVLSSTLGFFKTFPLNDSKTLKNNVKLAIEKKIEELENDIESQENNQHKADKQMEGYLQGAKKIYNGDTKIRGLGDAIFYATKNNFWDNLNSITWEDYKENLPEPNKFNEKVSDKKINEAIKLQQERLDLEHDIEVNINTILDRIIFNCDQSINNKYTNEISNYVKNNDMPLSYKLTNIVTLQTIFKLISVESDSGLRGFITKLRNLYAHGGLVDVNDDELKNLFDISVYYRNLLVHKDLD